MFFPNHKHRFFPHYGDVSMVMFCRLIVWYSKAVFIIIVGCVYHVFIAGMDIYTSQSYTTSALHCLSMP